MSSKINAVAWISRLKMDFPSPTLYSTDQYNTAIGFHDGHYLPRKASGNKRDQQAHVWQSATALEYQAKREAQVTNCEIFLQDPLAFNGPSLQPFKGNDNGLAPSALQKN